MDKYDELKNELKRLKVEFEKYKQQQEKYLKIVPFGVCPICFQKTVTIKTSKRASDEIVIHYKCQNNGCRNYNIEKAMNYTNMILANSLEQNQP